MCTRDWQGFACGLIACHQDNCILFQVAFHLEQEALDCMCLMALGDPEDSQIIPCNPSSMQGSSSSSHDPKSAHWQAQQAFQEGHGAAGWAVKVLGRQLHDDIPPVGEPGAHALLHGFHHIEARAQRHHRSLWRHAVRRGNKPGA